MKKSNKKGFTIVELVIVIAVIAILAAVLIPTFSGLVKKANLSSDKQAVRQMNIALAADEAKNGKPANLTKAREVLVAAGYAGDYLKPVTAGHAFFWSQDLNIIGLIDLETPTEVNGTKVSDYSLAYPTDNADATNAFGKYFNNWFNLSKYDEAISEKVSNAIKNATNGVISITDLESSDSDVSAGGLTFQEVVAYCSTSGAKLDGCEIKLPETAENKKIELDVKSYGRINELKGKIVGADSGTTIVVKNLDAVHDVKGNGEGYLLADYVEKKEDIHKQKVGTAFINYLGEGGLVENITIEYDQQVAPNDPGNKYTYYGGVVGFLNGGTVKNCTVTGTIQQYNRVGGIVGFAIGGNIENCSVENLTMKIWKSANDTTGWYTYAGGIVAFAGKEYETATTLTIKNCTVSNLKVEFAGYSKLGTEGTSVKGKINVSGSIIGCADANTKAEYTVVIDSCTVNGYTANSNVDSNVIDYIGANGGNAFDSLTEGILYKDKIKVADVTTDGNKTTYVFVKTSE